MKINLIILSVFGSVLLGNLSQSEQAIASNVSSNQVIAEAGASKQSRGGQVVEQGAYHLELVPEKGKDGVHLDFYLQKGDNHQTIPNAKVTGQVQLPNGTQKNLTFKYDADGKTIDEHYQFKDDPFSDNVQNEQVYFDTAYYGDNKTPEEAVALFQYQQQVGQSQDDGNINVFIGFGGKKAE